MTGQEYLDSLKAQPGLASGTPTTVVDTGPTKRPRMTGQQYLDSLNQQPQVSKETVEAVQNAPQPESQQEQPGFMDRLGQAASNIIQRPITATTGAISGLLAAGGEAVQQVGAAITPFEGAGSFTGALDAIGQKAMEGQQLGEQSIAPVIVEEALPTAGSMIATAVAPEVGIPLLAGKAARYGGMVAEAAPGFMSKATAVADYLLPKVAQVGGFAFTSAAGAGAGETVEQAIRYATNSEEDPEDLNVILNRVTDRASDEAIMNALAGGAINVLGPVLRKGGTAFLEQMSSPEQLKHLAWKRENGIPVTAGDYGDGMMGNVIRFVERNSMLNVGKGEVATGTKEAITKVAGKNITQAMDEAGTLMGKDGSPLVDTSGRMFEMKYGDVPDLPSDVKAAYVKQIIDMKDDRRWVLGGRYAAIDEILAAHPTVGVKEVQGFEDYLIDNAGGSGYMASQRVAPKVIPTASVDIASVKSKLADTLKAKADTMTPEGFIEYQKELGNVLMVNRYADSMSLSGANSMLGDLKEAQRTYKQQGDSDKVRRIGGIIEDVLTQMDSTADGLADKGITYAGKNISELIKQNNSLWRDTIETYNSQTLNTMVARAGEGNMRSKVDADAIASVALSTDEATTAVLRALQGAGEGRIAKQWVEKGVVPEGAVKPEPINGDLMQVAMGTPTGTLRKLRAPEMLSMQQPITLEAFKTKALTPNQTATQALNEVSTIRGGLAAATQSKIMQDMFAGKANEVDRMMQDTAFQNRFKALYGEDMLNETAHIVAELSKLQSIAPLNRAIAGGGDADFMAGFTRTGKQAIATSADMIVQAPFAIARALGKGGDDVMLALNTLRAPMVGPGSMGQVIGGTLAAPIVGMTPSQKVQALNELYRIGVNDYKKDIEQMNDDQLQDFLYQQQMYLLRQQ